MTHLHDDFEFEGSQADYMTETYGNEPCCNPGGHRWVCTGTAYGGDDDRWMGEGRCYCEFCGADGDA